MKTIRIAIIGETTIFPPGALTRSGAIAAEIARVKGTEVTLRAVAPDAAAAGRLTAALSLAGVRGQITHRHDASDSSPIRNGDTLDIWNLFGHDVVILDFDDATLRSFLTDLPAHTKPDVRLLGTLDYARAPLSPADREVAFRFDTLIGTPSQIKHLAGSDNAQSGLAKIHAQLRGVNLRATVLMGDGSLKIAEIDEPLQSIPLPPDSSREDMSRIIAHTAICVARREEWSTIAESLATSEQHARPILD
ncbi:MAG: hypothetical protein ACR2OE_03590 [Thermomicrobiales bacterium]